MNPRRSKAASVALQHQHVPQLCLKTYAQLDILQVQKVPVQTAKHTMLQGRAHMRPTAPSSSGTVMCQRRSFVRLESQALTTCDSMVTKYSASVISAIRDACRACRSQQHNTSGLGFYKPQTRCGRKESSAAHHAVTDLVAEFLGCASAFA